MKLDLLYILRLSLHQSEVSDVLSPRCQTYGLNEASAKPTWCSSCSLSWGWLGLLLAVKHPLILGADLSMKSTVCTEEQKGSFAHSFHEYPFFFPFLSSSKPSQRLWGIGLVAPNLSIRKGQGRWPLCLPLDIGLQFPLGRILFPAHSPSSRWQSPALGNVLTPVVCPRVKGKQALSISEQQSNIMSCVLLRALQVP